MWPARIAADSVIGSKRIPTEDRMSIRSSLVSSIAWTSATTAAQTTTSSRAKASPTQVSDASAWRGSPIRMSNRIGVSTATIGPSLFQRIAGRAPADGAHRLVGAGVALGQAEAPAHLAQRLADVLAQDDPAAFQLDLENRTLGQPKGIAYRLRQGDLAAFGNRGFHRTGSGQSGYARNIHTFFVIFNLAY